MTIALLKSYLGGFFYLSAGVYILFTKSQGIITVISMISCFALAGLSVTVYKDWSAIGGVMLIGGSLFLQSIYSYRCIDCIRADILIFTGMAILVFFTEQGKHKALFRVMGLTAAFILAFNISVHYNLKTVIGLNTLTVIEESKNDECAQREVLGDKIKVISKENEAVALEIGKKPIVLFSPSCGVCVETMETLVKADPKGFNWVAVQAYGNRRKGEKLLKENGYTGEYYVIVTDWHKALPVMLAKDKGGKAISINDQEQMLAVIKGKNY